MSCDIGHFRKRQYTYQKKLQILSIVNITATHGAPPGSCEKNESVFLKGFFDVDDILIGGASEKKGRILQLFHKFSIHEDVDVRKKLAELFRVTHLTGEQILFKGKAGIAPDRFLRETGSDSAEQSEKSVSLLGLHRLAAEKGKTCDILTVERLDDLLHGVIRERGAIIEAPLLGIEASLAVVATSADKK
jgi:hypothetical protein